jgi:hypothetical protein
MVVPTADSTQTRLWLIGVSNYIPLPSAKSCTTLVTNTVTKAQDFAFQPTKRGLGDRYKLLKRKANELNADASGAAAMTPARRIQPSFKRAKTETKSENLDSAPRMPLTPTETSASDDQGTTANEGVAETPSKPAKKKTAVRGPMVVKKEPSPVETFKRARISRTPNRKANKRKRIIDDYDSLSEEEAVFTDAETDNESAAQYDIKHLPSRAAKQSASATGAYAPMDGGSDYFTTEDSSDGPGRRARKTRKARKTLMSDDSDGDWTRSGDEGHKQPKCLRGWRERALLD